MKKWLSLMLAVLFVLTLNITAFAAESQDISFTVSVSESTKVYNSGGRILIKLSIDKINFGETDGISAIEFDLKYDSSKVVPLTTPTEDADADICDLTSAITLSPDSAWEAFGTIDESGSVGIVLSDSTGKNALFYDNSLTLEFAFSVKPTTKADDIIFTFENLTAYNCDLSKYCTATAEDVVVEYSAIPAAFAALPDVYVPLDVAGYRHNVNNVIFSTQTEITVADYIKYFSDNGINQAKMCNFAIMIANESDGAITYIDTEISTQSDKSAVIIPANSYIIGVFGINTEDLEYIKANAAVGSYITVYNVNIEGTRKTNSATMLEKAGFTISSEAPENPYINGSISGSESNVALGKYYTTSELYRQGNADNNWGYDESAVITYPDEENCTLTDGEITHPETKYTETDAWVGFHAATPDALESGYCYIRLDLQEKANISKFIFHVASKLNGDGITVPSSLSVYGSADGVNYTDFIGTVTPQDVTTSYLVSANITADVSYRYLEIRIKASTWALISEIEVIGYYGEKVESDNNQGGTTTPPADDENQGGTTIPPADDENQGGTTTPPVGDENPPSAGTVYLLGDVNGNGRIDSRDYLLLKRAHFGTYLLSEAESLRSDINGNGKIDSRDYLLLKRIYFGTYSLPESEKYITINI